MAPSYGQREKEKVLQTQQQQQQQQSSEEECSGHGHNPNDVGQSGGEPINNIRKYLLLLQDCLAIKFVPLITDHSHHPFQFAYNNHHNHTTTSNNHNSNNNKSKSNSIQNVDLPEASNTNYQRRNNNKDHQQTSFSSLYFQPGFSFSESIESAAQAIIESSTTEVEHSLHSLALYKGFKEANLQCFYNSTLWSAIRKLEYKGHIVPSIILIWSPPKFLTIIRSAWARKMLRSAPGYSIQFVGEIEELIAEPVNQSQFAPLSDSLCRVILDLTTMGQEAFLDNIISMLNMTFPQMALPNREIVYTTLEKLIREKKIYQTSNGYFVVTPDTLIQNFMTSSSASHQQLIKQQQPNYPGSFSTTALTLDALSPSSSHYENENDLHKLDNMSFSRHHSWDSATMATNNTTSAGQGREGGGMIKSSLKRHNSLKLFRQKDNVLGNGWLGRSMSFRMAKSKSLVDSESNGIEGKSKSEAQLLKEIKNIKDEKRSKKGKSFFSKIFAFRRSKSSKRGGGSVEGANAKSKVPEISFNPKDLEKKNEPINKLKSNCGVSSTISTQTGSNSTEHLPLKCSERVTRSPTQIRASTSQINNENEQSGEFILNDPPLLSTMPPSPVPVSSLLSASNKWNSLPKRSHHSSSRRSISALMDDGPLYATPNLLPNSTSPQPTIRNFHLGRGESSRCSTLSNGASSLGYGSQGPQSPSPSINSANTNAGYSMQNGSYKSYYDYYRRRYPSYMSQNNNYGYNSFNNGRSSGSRPRSSQGKWNLYETIGNGKYNFEHSPLSKQSGQKYSSSHQITDVGNGNNNNDSGTTTVKQNVKSTTNMEVELLLPINKILSAALAAGRNKENNGKTSINLGKLDGAKMKVGQTVGQTEIKTTVNQNGTVETHFDTLPSTMTSTFKKNNLEIKTNPNNITTTIFNRNGLFSDKQKSFEILSNIEKEFGSHQIA